MDARRSSASMLLLGLVLLMCGAVMGEMKTTRVEVVLAVAECTRRVEVGAICLQIIFLFLLFI